MHRYVAAAQNAYYKAISQLAKLQKERSLTQEQSSASEIGFVSYSDASSRILDFATAHVGTPGLLAPESELARHRLV